MPILIKRPKPASVFEAELVSRQCKLETYIKKAVKAIKVNEEIITYCSPDSTYAVTKRLFDKAKKSILIGIYDLSSSHMRDMLLDALARKVKVSLMLDIDSQAERDLFDELVIMGVKGVSAPSCANKVVSFFSSSHEKVIVIDNEWSLVQSGNYSDHSFPFNIKDGGDSKHFKTGNRDTGLAVKSKVLAQFLTKILRSDMALVHATAELLAHVIEDEPFLVEAAPKKQPATLFPSKSFKLNADLELLPILSPDNYMDVVPRLLALAKKSILIEQQYIKASQLHIVQLLNAVKTALGTNPALDVRIVLGKIFNSKDLPKEEANLKILKEKYGLALGKNIRYINTDQLVHCHNKMILIDGKGVLVSSQNWSDSAVTKNREAGLWLQHPGIGKYFTSIFETDWKAAFKTPAIGKAQPESVTPEALGAGGFIPVVRADYEEV